MKAVLVTEVWNTINLHNSLLQVEKSRVKTWPASSASSSSIWGIVNLATVGNENKEHFKYCDIFNISKGGEEWSSDNCYNWDTGNVGNKSNERGIEALHATWNQLARLSYDPKATTANFFSHGRKFNQNLQIWPHEMQPQVLGMSCSNLWWLEYRGSISKSTVSSYVSDRRRKKALCISLNLKLQRHDWSQFHLSQQFRIVSDLRCT